MSESGLAVLRATTNNVVTRAYARVALGFLRDCAAAGRIDPAQPVHLLELAPGSGRFAYSFVRNLTAMLSQSSLAGLRVKLILPDASPHWLRSHFRMTELFEAGLAELGTAEMAHANPVVVLANHLFESMPADAFWIDAAGVMQESLVTVRAAQESVDWAAPEIVERVGIGWERRPVGEDYYPDPLWNKILQQSCANLREATLIFPTGALGSVANLVRACGGQFLLLTSGSGGAADWCGSLARVNYDAVGRYFAESGGASFLTQYGEDGLATGAFCPLPGCAWKETGLAFREAIEAICPLDLDGPLGVREYLARLRRSNYDGLAAWDRVDEVLPQIVDVPGEIKDQLRLAIDEVWAGYYPLGEAEDVMLALGKLRIALGDWVPALEFLEASRTVYGETEPNSYQMALCHFGQVDLEAASEWIEKALTSNAAEERYLSLRDAIAETRAARQTMDSEQVLDILAQADQSSAFFAETAKMLDTCLAPNGYPAPETESTEPRKRLTIGMATYDDWDGVYFSVQAIRLYHPEVTERTEIVVIDNHPEGPASEQLRELGNYVRGYRYVPVSRPRGTVVRDLVFRHSNADFVLCMDAHVFFAPGSLAALLDFLDANPDTPNLLQGPLVYDDLTTISTHWDPKWSAGMWGTWGEDKRGLDPASPPFEIPLQGLGVFGCRRDAWLGFNPRFRGFGGEEGYIHEKFRHAGAATLCLPFLRWVHRFGRPNGVPYNPRYRDGVRNFLIGFDELGMDAAPVIQHFEELLGADEARSIVDAVRKEIEGPFYYFDAIYCINLDNQQERWEQAMEQFRRLGIGEAVERFPAVETPDNHHIGCALSHRAIVAEAKRRGLRNVLVLEDDVVFAPDAEEILRRSLEELREREWPLFYLGGAAHGQTFEKAPGCKYLEMARVTCTHAVAYSERVYDRILAEIPGSPTGMALWCRTHLAIDQYYCNAFDGTAVISSPVIATQTNLLPYEQRSFETV